MEEYYAHLSPNLPRLVSHHGHENLCSLGYDEQSLLGDIAHRRIESNRFSYSRKGENKARRSPWYRRGLFATLRQECIHVECGRNMQQSWKRMTKMLLGSKEHDFCSARKNICFCQGSRFFLSFHNFTHRCGVSLAYVVVTRSKFKCNNPTFTFDDITPNHSISYGILPRILFRRFAEEYLYLFLEGSLVSPAASISLFIRALSSSAS